MERRFSEPCKYYIMCHYFFFGVYFLYFLHLTDLRISHVFPIVQSIKCGSDGYFIYILHLLAWWQIFLPFLGLCPIVFKTGPRPFQGHVSILRVLRYFGFLGLVVELLYLPQGFVGNTFQGCSFNIKLLSFIFVLGFSSSHTFLKELGSHKSFLHFCLDTKGVKLLIVSKF